MLRHIVMMKFSDRKNWQTTAEKVSCMLNALPEQVTSLKSMETGINLSSRDVAFDLVLTADFADEAGLEAYRIHSAHVTVLEYLKPRVAQTTVVDYLIS